jgi:cellulose synthase operon protein C
MRERWEDGVQAVQCGSLHVDLVHRRITVSDVQVHLPPRILDLLTFFMAQPDQLHTREAIIAEVWAGLVVEEGSLSQSVWLLRKALGSEWRDSIQSVPKRGYVFHPLSQITLITGGASSVEAANPLDPLDIARPEQSDATALPEFASPDEPPATALPEFTPPGEPPAAARALLSMTRVRLALAAFLLLVLIGVGAVAGLKSAAPPSLRTVALLLKPTQQSEVRARHTALLLEDWLRYRLGGSVELLVLTNEDLDEEDAYLPSVTAVISLVPVAADSDGLKARVEVLDGKGSNGPQRIEQLISLANFDADMGSLSAQVITLIDSDMQGNNSPRYAIGKARDTYASALDANKRRRFDDALVLFNAALLQAPDFAPLRYRLAHLQANAGEIGVANEQLRTVRALEPNWNPNGLYELELERAHAKTAAELSRVAERYLELYRQHPARLDLFLVGIDAQVSFTERLRLLASVDWTAQPSVISRKAKLLECWALLGIGQPAEAEVCASAVIKRVPASGSLFSMRHLGEAQSILAIARYNQATEDPSFSEFKTAAKTYTQAGWGLQALRIRAQAEILSGHPGQQEMPHLAELLALVERNRLPLVQLNLFRSLATRLFNLHDAPEAIK